jgi:hypothetical protein
MNVVPSIQNVVLLVYTIVRYNFLEGHIQSVYWLMQ